MSEKNVKPVEISVESAIAELEKALNNAHVLHSAANAALQAVAGALLGGIGAFHKDPRKLSVYVEQALKLVRKDTVMCKYYKRIKDYIEHESGIVADEYGYTMDDTSALAKAQESVKTTSLLDYESEETQKQKGEKANERALAKQAFTDSSAKERVLAFLKGGIDDAKKRRDKADNRYADKRNGVEVDKTTEEIKLFEQLIELLSKQQ